MRKIPAALAVLGLTTVGLAGCSMPAAPAACEREVSTPSDLFSVSGSADSAPDVEVYTPLRVDETEAQDLVVGDGTAISTDDQLVVMDLTIVSGDTGETVLETAYDGTLTSAFPLANLVQNIPAFSDALHCATEGSRVALALAPGDITADSAASIGLSDDESAVAVVDLRKVYLAKAEGSLVYNSGMGLPSVVRAPDGTPGVVIPDADPRDETVVQTLIRGEGEEVTGDVPIRVHYTGVNWETREAFDSTWDSEPASLTLDGVVPGFAAALEGQTVGSQIMVVVAPEDGYGDEGSGSIPGGATLVFVIDILGLDEPAA